MANVPAGGEKVLVVISDKLEKIITRKLAPTLFVISERLCMR
jgi:hypothetical protein